MLLTFIIDPPFVLFLGYCFALAIPFSSRRPLARTRAFIAGLATFIIFCLGAIVAFIQYPDWMWMYFVDLASRTWSVRALHLLGGLVVYYVLYCLGFLWGAKAHAQQGKRAWWGALLLLIASGVIILPFFPRYYHVGTVAQFTAGQGVPLPQSPLAMVYNIALPLMAVVGGVGFLLARWEKDERYT